MLSHDCMDLGVANISTGPQDNRRTRNWDWTAHACPHMWMLGLSCGAVQSDATLQSDPAGFYMQHTISGLTTNCGRT